MLRLGLINSERAFYPENRAYYEYLSAHDSVDVRVFNSLSEAEGWANLIIFHCGLLPFWRRVSVPLIMEYHSLSTGRFAKLKNIMKRMLNKRGVGYIFLSDQVRKGFFFSSLKSENYIIRGMGYISPGKLAINQSTKFDFAYMGKVGRTGLKGALTRVADLGFSIVIIGCNDAERKDLHGYKGLIYCYGRLEQVEALKLVKTARYALNFTPDVYPLNIQDSTKIIEYCSLRMNVVSNKYEWVQRFESEYGARFLDFEAFLANPRLLTSFAYSCGETSHLEWNRVLDDSGFKDFVTGRGNCK